MFSKKVWVSVVWAAFRERNFEVGEPFLRARSVPSKYCFFRTYASAKRIFLIKSHISSLFLHLIPLVPPSYATYLPPISIGTSLGPHWNLIGTSSEPHRMMSVSSSSYYWDLYKSHLIWFLLPLTQKKSHSPCAYAIFLLPLRSNLLHHIYYKNNHHYPSSNYGTQVLSSLWCSVYLSARESRQVPMCRCGTLSRNSCTSGSAIPQPMPLPQVPVGVLCLSNVCLLSRIIRVFPASKP